MLDSNLTGRRQQPSPPNSCFQVTSSATKYSSARVPPTDPGQPGPVLQVDQLFCGLPAALTGVGPPAAAALQTAAQFVALWHVVPEEGAGEQVKRSPSTKHLFIFSNILFFNFSCTKHVGMVNCCTENVTNKLLGIIHRK